MLDDLERKLEQYEARLRESRRLLAQQKHRRAATPEETVAIAALLFQVSAEADALAEKLNGLLKAESEKRTQAIRERQYVARTINDVLPTATDKPDFGSEKLFGKDRGDEDETSGNAPVPAFPRRPVPVLAGGAARRFEESDEPPRNP